MEFAAILIGAVIIVAAFSGGYTQLATELENDIPGFFKWAVAIALILGLGFVPGLQKPSRWLLVLVAVVILLTQWQTIFAGLNQFTASSGKASAPSPAGSLPGASGAATAGPAAASPLSGLDPQNYLTEFALAATGVF